MADTQKEKDPDAAGDCKEPVPHALDYTASAELAFVGDDGIKLFPQPIAGDGLDPLSWSFAQKHVILAILMALYVAPFLLTVDVELSTNEALGRSQTL